MPIEIIVAQPHGFCGDSVFGVSAAISKAIEASKEYPGNTFLLKEIVHNSHVVNWLFDKYGLKTVSSLEEIPEGSVVVLRSHGSSPETYQLAKQRNLTIIDTTCPLVIGAQRQAKKLANKGRKIIYLASAKDHDEAISVYYQAPDSTTITTLNEILDLKIEDPENTIILTQTTLSTLETAKVFSQLKKRYPMITIVPHICPATTARQQAVIKLAKEIGFVIIVGHPTSSNSNRLKEVATDSGAEAYIVDTETDLQKKWFINKKKVAISSGASTPDWLLQRVIDKIKEI